MNGFLIREDGALINLDQILYVAPVELSAEGLLRWSIHIIMVGGYIVPWNREPISVDDMSVMLQDLRAKIQRAVEY